MSVIAIIIGRYLAWVQPGDDKIIVRGTAPDGREYFVVQTYSGSLAEPYQVSFFLRDMDGVWRWSYVAHESVSWRSGRVVIEAGSAQVYRGETRERVVDLDSSPLTEQDYAWEHAFPADWTVEQVAAWHHDRYGEDCPPASPEASR